MSKKWVYAIPLVLLACQKSPGPFEGMARDDQSGTDGYTEQGDQRGTDGFEQRPTADQRMIRPDVPQAVENLRQYVDELRGTDEIQYTDLSTALRTLSAAFQTLPGAGPGISDAVSRIDSYADRIEAAGATSDMHTRWVKRAMGESVDALEKYQEERGFTGMTDRIQGLRDQIDEINVDKPFSQQKNAFVAALSQVSDELVEVSAPRRQQGTQ